MANGSKQKHGDMHGENQYRNQWHQRNKREMVVMAAGKASKWAGGG